jgi:hypothetical protein
MTLRALAGLLALNGAYLAVGSTLVWAARGWGYWREWARFAGLAYLVGVAGLGIVWTLMLVVGFPMRAPAFVAGAVLLAGFGVIVGRARGRRWPGSSPPLALTALSLVTAAGIAVVGVFFEALFRAGRLHGLYAFDAWSFWIPKAKAIYVQGELDVDFLLQVAHPSYPPLVPLLDAAAFHAMGGVDVVTLHLQYWFYALGFVAAIVGLLVGRVPPWILWPFVVLAVVAPRMSESLLVPQADFLLQFFALAAVVVAVSWLQEEARWPLPVVVILLGAAVLTKREGLLLSAIVFGALAVATCDRARRAWPQLAGAGLAVVAIAVPWRLWYRDRGLTGESPPGFLPPFGRVWDSLELSLDVFFDPALWSLVTALGIAAVAISAIWGDRRLALYLGTLLVLLVLGGAWVSAAFTDLPISADEAVNPIVRYTGGVALLSGLAAPILLAGVWARSRREAEAAP